MRISRDCFANFVADFHTTFVRVSRECRENFLVSRTSREVFQHVEKFYAIFFSKTVNGKMLYDTKLQYKNTCL